MSTELTKEQKEIIRHSLGLDNNHVKAYRNYFYTSEDTTDYPILASLIEAGFMIKGGSPFGPDMFYCHVTEEGAQPGKK